MGSHALFANMQVDLNNAFLLVGFGHGMKSTHSCATPSASMLCRSCVAAGVSWHCKEGHGTAVIQCLGTGDTAQQYESAA